MFIKWKHGFIFSVMLLCFEVLCISSKKLFDLRNLSVFLQFPVKPGMCTQSIYLDWPSWASSQQILETTTRFSISEMCLLLNLSETHIVMWHQILFTDNYLIPHWWYALSVCIQKVWRMSGFYCWFFWIHFSIFHFHLGGASYTLTGFLYWAEHCNSNPQHWFCWWMNLRL